MKSAAMLFESVFAENHHTLLKLLKRRVGCDEIAEELVQEAYLKVFQQNAVEEIVNLPGFLYRTAVNLSVDHIRSASRAASAGTEPLSDDLVCPRPTPDDAVQARQELDRFSEMIAELPERCRTVFLMHRVQHLSHAEIGRRLGISPRTVENHICKALKTLRDRME